MNMCLISEEYPPETGWGGIGTYTYYLSQGLAQLGHRVYVIARSWGADAIEDVGGVQLHRLSIPEPSWRRGTYTLNLRLSETRQIVLWNWRVATTISRIRRSEELHVIESPEYHAQGLLTSLRNRSIPLVVKLHSPAALLNRINGQAIGGSFLDTLVSEELECRLARFGWMVTSPSHALAEAVGRRWRLPRSRIRVIPNPIDTSTFTAPIGVTREDRTVLYVGRIERRKGVETIIEAWPDIQRAVPDTHLVMAGNDHPSGPSGKMMVPYLHDRLDWLGVPRGTVEFTGPVERAALPTLYARAAVCLVPSLYENFPYTCLEAMACGCAVVASAVGGISEIITNGVDGVLVPPNNARALAAALVHLLTDDALRHRLGRTARLTVGNRFSPDIICRETVEAYRFAIAGRG
jgi:glycogen(starch) synthase